MFQCDVRLRFEIFGFKMGKVTMGHPEQYILNYEKNTERVLWKKSTKIILSKEEHGAWSIRIRMEHTHTRYCSKVLINFLYHRPSVLEGFWYR
jgi:hypothetical protein